MKLRKSLFSFKHFGHKVLFYHTSYMMLHLRFTLNHRCGDLLPMHGLAKYLTNRVDLSKMSGFTRRNHIETIVLE
jgi:hypothetical protein